MSVTPEMVLKGECPVRSPKGTGRSVIPEMVLKGVCPDEVTKEVCLVINKHAHSVEASSHNMGKYNN